MTRLNGLLLLKIMIILMTTLSSLLTICGTTWNIYHFKFVGLTLATVSTLLLIIFADDLNGASLIFTTTLIPLALSVSYEMLSEYPLGADVHSEYFVIKRTETVTQLSNIQEESRLFGIPEYYFEILNLIFSSNLVSKILGTDPLCVIKFIWNSLILGLTPLIVFIYTRSLVKDKRSALVSSALIYSQSTYISTLHSTVKQSVALFLATILFLLVIKISKENSTSSDLLPLIIVVVGLTGYHYFVSGATIMTFFIGLILFYTISLFFKSKNSRSLSEKLRTIGIITLSSMAIWITWYFIVFQHIIKPVVDLIISMFTLEKPAYYYEKINIPLPALVNLIRLGINGVIILGVLASGVMAFMNIRKGSYVDSIVTVTSLLFLLGVLGELAGTSTIGIGRTSLVLLVFTAPYFYGALFFAIYKLFKPFYRKTTIMLLIIALILSLRMYISLGVASYVSGEIKGTIFLDPDYKYTASLTQADLQTASLIFDKSAVNEIRICSDYWSRIPFIYAYTAYTKTPRISITFTNYFVLISEKENLYHSSCLIFLSSYNVVKKIIQVSVVMFKDINEYMPYISSANSLIYQSNFTYVFLNKIL